MRISARRRGPRRSAALGVDVDDLEAAVAEDEAGHDEQRRQRQEAAPGQAGQHRPDHQQRPEDDAGGPEAHAVSLPAPAARPRRGSRRRRGGSPPSPRGRAARAGTGRRRPPARGRRGPTPAAPAAVTGRPARRTRRSTRGDRPQRPGRHEVRADAARPEVARDVAADGLQRGLGHAGPVVDGPGHRRVEVQAHDRPAALAARQRLGQRRRQRLVGERARPQPLQGRVGRRGEEVAAQRVGGDEGDRVDRRRRGAPSAAGPRPPRPRAGPGR